MDWTPVMVFLVLLWPAAQLLRVHLIARALLALRVGDERIETLPPAAIPDFLRAAAADDLGRLAALGFQLRQGLRLTGPGGLAFERLWLDLAHRSEPIRAIVCPHDASNRSGECWIGFLTLRVNGPALLTVSHAETEAVDELSDVEQEVVWGADPAVLFNRHRERVAAARRSGPWVVDADDGAVALHYRWRREAGVAKLVAAGDVAPAPEGGLGWKLGAAYRSAFRFVGAERRRAKAAGPSLKRVSTKLLPEAAQNEFDWRHYLGRKALSGGRLPGRAKALIGLVSVVAFAGWLAWVMTPAAAIALLVAVFIHELGHLAGMWLFGHRDTQMLFLPFLGAAAIAHDEQPLAPWKELVILFLGPLPGLFFGLAILVAGPAVEWLRDAANMFVALNAFNLLPVLPLDGGRILDVAVANRFPRLRVAFVAASGALLALGWFAGLGLLGGLGVFMLLRLAHEWRTARTVAEIRAEGSEGVDEEPVVRRLLHRLRAPDWEKIPMLTRLTAAQHLQKLLRQPLPGVGTFVLALALYVSPLFAVVGFGVARGIAEFVSHRPPPAATAGDAPEYQPDPRVAETVPAAQNAAVPLDEALRQYRAQMEALDSAAAENLTSEQRRQRLAPVTTLVHEAARRPRFVPDPAEKPGFADLWLRAGAVGLLVDDARAAAARGERTQAIAAVNDLLRLLALLETAPDWWTQSSHAGTLTALFEWLEESGEPLDESTRLALVAATDEARLLAFARQAIPREHVRSADAGKLLFDQAADNAKSRGARWLFKAVGHLTRPDHADRRHAAAVAARLEQAVAAAAQGRWPTEPTEAELAEAENSDRYTIYSELHQLAQLVAHARLARTALAAHASQVAAGRAPAGFADIRAPWWTTPPTHPETKRPLRWVVADGRPAITFAPEKPVQPAGEDAEDDSWESLRQWRLPAPGAAQ